MQQPSISRAVPMGVLGFLVGALVVIIVRALTNMTPIWDSGIGIVFGTFFCAFFFVWGIGGFDPRLSAHGEEEEGEEPAHVIAVPEPAPTTAAVAGSSFWQVAFLVVVLIVIMTAMAKLGPALTTTTQNASSTLEIGMLPANVFGQDIVISTGVIFAAFVIIMLISLAIAGLIIWILIGGLSRGLTEAKAAAAGGGTVALSAAEEAPEPASTRPRALTVLLTLIKAVVIFAVLYAFFYYVAIGLILPKPVEQLIALSFINALLITIIILWPRVVILVVARVSWWVANLLRGGNLRGGKKVDGTKKVTRK